MVPSKQTDRHVGRADSFLKGGRGSTGRCGRGASVNSSAFAGPMGQNQTANPGRRGAGGYQKYKNSAITDCRPPTEPLHRAQRLVRAPWEFSAEEKPGVSEKAGLLRQRTAKRPERALKEQDDVRELREFWNPLSVP